MDECQLPTLDVGSVNGRSVGLSVVFIVSCALSSGRSSRILNSSRAVLWSSHRGVLRRDWT